MVFLVNEWSDSYSGPTWADERALLPSFDSQDTTKGEPPCHPPPPALQTSKLQNQLTAHSKAGQMGWKVELATLQVLSAYTNP